MADVPDTIVLRRDRDLEPRRNEIWVRRGLFALVCVVPVLALANVFGQGSQTSSAAVGAARLSLSAPSRVRGGLLYQARFHIAARQKLDQAELVLDQGWLDGLTINTIEPSPVSESSENGKLGLDLGPIPAGQSHVLVVDFQVNPTTVGRSSYLTYRSRRARRVLEGEPIVIVQDGKLIDSNMKRERLTEDEVAEEMRAQQIASVGDVEWGILESDGNMSFIPK